MADGVGDETVVRKGHEYRVVFRSEIAGLIREKVIGQITTVRSYEGLSKNNRPVPTGLLRDVQTLAAIRPGAFSLLCFAGTQVETPAYKMKKPMRRKS
ncbi:MAG: hypothetical protein JXA30_15830 [Deltaproteobacteria bacterium]|nr:hypothetical protein [Deltaproteobacteria bacterium]